MAVQPIRLHPQNPHYFLWRDKPTVLIGSGEHYGAVINLEFDYTKYLDTLHSDGLNQTRVFSGTFREVPGSFNIVTNTLAPAPGRFVCPWARSDVPGYADGGNKFDLTKWDEAYFARLKAFMGQAEKRGVVVEFVLFTPLYVDSMWDVSPMNVKNNINGIGAVSKDESLSLKHANLVKVQEAVTRKIVQELNGFDNVYFEICNEPYAGRVPGDWETRIAQTIAETEKTLPNRHLIAQNIANGTSKIENPNPVVSVFNFHYASPPDCVTLNYDLNKPITDDETGFKGNGDSVYRKEAWEFLLNGGSVFSHLDYSFTVGHENGDLPVPAQTPGGGGKAFRRQMKILKDFIEAFDFTQMKPARDSVKAGGATVYALAEAGKNYAIYLDGKTPTAALDLPAGNYRATWINVVQGNVEKSEDFAHGGGEKTLAAPNYEKDIALKVQALPGLVGAESVLPTAKVKFPLRASADGRYLVDAADKPFFYQADTPWFLLLQLTLPEVEEYIDDRKAKGFSALQIMSTGWYGMKNLDGHLPFENDDFAKPNEAFWAHTDQVVQIASDKGMFLMMAPLWSGCCGEGWAGVGEDKKLRPLTTNGPEKAKAWGRWLGVRYGKSKNIAWLLGGDKNPGESHELIRQLGRGLHETAPQQLKAVHNAHEHSSADFYDDQDWLSLNAAYTYREVFAHVLEQWERPKIRPVFLAESGYEREANDTRWGSPFRIRRQAYGAILSGALAGHAYGNHDGWRLNEKWRESLQDVGAAQLAFTRRLFDERAWWKLVPEAAEELITLGRGKVGDDDFLSAARASDGSLAIVYVPQSRAFTVDLARLQSPLRAQWFDPTNGQFAPAQPANLSAKTAQQFTPPEKNSAGESDWVLALESAK